VGMVTTVENQAQVGTEAARLRGLHRISLVVNRRGWASQVRDFIDLHKRGVGDVVAKQLEALVV